MRICGDCHGEHLGGDCGYPSLMARLKGSTPGLSLDPTILQTTRTTGLVRRRWHGELERYRRTRMEGIQPRTTKTEHIDQALRRSDREQAAFRADRASIREREREKAAAAV